MTHKFLFRILFLLTFIFVISVSCNPKINQRLVSQETKKIISDTIPQKIFSDSIKKDIKLSEDITEPGDKQFNEYLPLLSGKRVAVVANQTSMIDSIHLLDFLISNKINVIKIFALEHGFRGKIDRGEQFSTEIDKKTGIPIVPMYGKNRKPKPEQLTDIDIVVFDIQDIGVRFFTYISSMHLLMEACAENNKKLIILDRPNPLGFYVDGPVLKPEFKSFVGMHPIPIVHGLTEGELALMINGEGWLKNHIKCDVQIIKNKNYTHSKRWHLPIKPSPNLPNDQAILLYPSLCFFEATDVSIGRGTEFPFQVIGYPDTSFGNFTFIPVDIPGMQMNPIQEGKKCYGIDLRKTNNPFFTLQYLIDFYNKFSDKSKFITRKRWFNLLAGNSELYNQIMSGIPENEIRKSWQQDLNKYKEIRKKYLLYLDF